MWKTKIRHSHGRARRKVLPLEQSAQHVRFSSDRRGQAAHQALSPHAGDLAADRGPVRPRDAPRREAHYRDRGRRGEGRAAGEGTGGRERGAEGHRGAVPGLGPRAAPGAGRVRARAAHPQSLPLQGP
jgi:hypothetical protein